MTCKSRDQRDLYYLYYHISTVTHVVNHHQVLRVSYDCIVKYAAIPGILPMPCHLEPYMLTSSFSSFIIFLFFSSNCSPLLVISSHFSFPFSLPTAAVSINSTCNSSPASLSGHFSPLPITTVRAFVFIARRFQHLLPSSTINSIELRLPTLLYEGVLSCWSLAGWW